MQEKLNVVFTIDENYIQHFCVACTSLLENNQNIGRIFLVQDIHEMNHKLEKTINFFDTKYGVKIEKLGLDSDILKNFKITHHISKATYFRLLLSEIIPSDINKVLFLDSDIVVVDDLSSLIELDFYRDDNKYSSHRGTDMSYSRNDEYYIYGVNHKFSHNDLKRLRDINFEGDKYFNAGIMYINLKQWRESDLSRILIENATKYNEHLLLWDQDVLNVTLEKQWGELSFEYNAFNLHTIDEDADYKIIHYTGSSKPWHFKNQHPCKHLYWRYLKMTPFKRYIHDDLTVVNIIKWIIPKNIKEFIKGYR